MERKGQGTVGRGKIPGKCGTIKERAGLKIEGEGDGRVPKKDVRKKVKRKRKRRGSRKKNTVGYGEVLLNPVYYLKGEGRRPN